MKYMKARDRGERRIYQLLPNFMVESCLNGAAGNIEERIPLNTHVTEICLAVMKWWVADDLEQSSVLCSLLLSVCKLASQGQQFPTTFTTVLLPKKKKAQLL